MDDKFLKIFNMYKNDVYRFAYSYTKNLSDADDVTQNVFIKLYKNSNVLMQDDINIKKWLIKVTLNECKTLFLSFWQKKITSISEKEENTLYKCEADDEMLDIILKLPKKWRIVIFLYYYDGYKINEIAEMLLMSETNIQTILYRARNQLKEILKEA